MICILSRWITCVCVLYFLSLIEFPDEVGTANTAQALLNLPAFLGLVPEEILSLCQFLAWRLGREDRFKGVGVIARVPHFCGNGHGGRSEVLNLFQMKVELLGEYCQFGHVFLMTARVAGDEVGDDLLVQMLLAVDAVEHALELVELLK